MYIFAEEHSAKEGKGVGGGGEEEREWRCKQAAQNKRATSQAASTSWIVYFNT